MVVPAPRTTEDSDAAGRSAGKSETDIMYGPWPRRLFNPHVRSRFSLSLSYLYTHPLSFCSGGGLLYVAFAPRENLNLDDDQLGVMKIHFLLSCHFSITATLPPHSPHAFLVSSPSLYLSRLMHFHMSRRDMFLLYFSSGSPLIRYGAVGYAF